MNTDIYKYWRWLIIGLDGKPGLLRFWNRWLIYHTLIGVVIAVLVKTDYQTAEKTLQTTANTVLLPLAGVLIGLSFAWAGNAQSLIQSTEIQELAKFRDGGFVEYVYTYQTAILTILATVIMWGIAGLGIIDSHIPARDFPVLYETIKYTFFIISSISLRECWHVILGTQWLLITQILIVNNSKNVNNKITPTTDTSKESCEPENIKKN